MSTSSKWKLRLLSSIFIVLGLFWQEVDSSKILIFNGMGEGSHYFAAAALAEELHHRGHSISFLIGSQFSFRAKQLPHRDMFDYRIVHTNASTKGSFQLATKEAFEGKIVFRDVNFLMSLGQELADECHAVFNASVLDDLQRAHFDLFICDPLWPCTVVLGEYLGLEKVVIIPISLSATLISVLGGTTNPAVTAQFGIGYPTQMTFFQRLNNFVLFHWDTSMLMAFADLPYKQLFHDKNVTGYGESLRKINLYIVASDPILDQQISTMPGHVQAAGLTIRKPKPLPQDIEEFLSSAGDAGVIIFSLGSYVTHMPEPIVKDFQDAFSRLPQKVLWQWINDDVPENMPKNVKTMSWLPQMDLLAHNQTKLLFYQGGNNGIYEAIHFAVPVLVMPLIADQHDVAQRVVESGIGLRIRVTEVTSDRVVECITTILKDQRYQQKLSTCRQYFVTDLRRQEKGQHS